MKADSTYDDKTDTLLINLDVKNNGASPLNLKQYIMAMATFVNGDKDEQAKAGPAHYVGQMQVEPDAPIAARADREAAIEDQQPAVRRRAADPAARSAGTYRRAAALYRSARP